MVMMSLYFRLYLIDVTLVSLPGKAVLPLVNGSSLFSGSNRIYSVCILRLRGKSRVLRSSSADDIRTSVLKNSTASSTVCISCKMGVGYIVIEFFYECS